MADLVAGFLLPHVPLIKANEDAAPAHQRAAVHGAFDTIVSRLREREVDTLIVIGSDHCSLFGSECLPPCLIGTGDVRGPLEEWLGIPSQDIDNHAALARHIVDVGFASGVDWSVARNLTVDHAIMIPWHYVAAPLGRVRVIPVYLNAGVEPALRFDRAHHIGKAIGDAVRSWPGDERVAILGTGGLSHWVGMAQMGQVNDDWDRRMIALMEAGDMPALLALRDEDVLEQAGNGALEIKNHICAMAAMPQARARLIAYEPVREWVCGCAFLELESG